MGQKKGLDRIGLNQGKNKTLSNARLKDLLQCCLRVWEDESWAYQFSHLHVRPCFIRYHSCRHFWADNDNNPNRTL